jgi:psp operon transcriptional activator
VERRVDVRVTAATNADLKKMCRVGTFLPDLWDRLSFEVITLPPLRERPGDISFLTHYFAARMAQELGLSVSPIFSQEALEALENYLWPGNVRELKNAVERVIYRASGSGLENIGPELLQLETGIYATEAEPVPYPVQPDGHNDGHNGGHYESSSQFQFNQPAGQPTGPSESFPESALAAIPELPLAPGQFDQLFRKVGQKLIDLAMNRADQNQIRSAELLGLSYHRFRSLRRKFFSTK